MRSAELIALELNVLLFLALVLTQATLQRNELDEDYLLSARDAERTLKGVFANRAERALSNFTENYAAFVAADLGLVATGRTGGRGAMLWVFARIAYLPVYVAGVPVVRTVCWIVSIIGLLMILARLAGI